MFCNPMASRPIHATGLFTQVKAFLVTKHGRAAVDACLEDIDNCFIESLLVRHFSPQLPSIPTTLKSLCALWRWYSTDSLLSASFGSLSIPPRRVSPPGRGSRLHGRPWMGSASQAVQYATFWPGFLMLLCQTRA